MNPDAQDITNWLTLALAVATVWLAVATQKMARATKESVELQSHPYLSIDGLALSIGQAHDISSSSLAGLTRLALVLSNPGQVLVTYEVEELKVSFQGTSINSPNFLTRRAVLHPKGQGQFFYPTIKLGEQLRPGQSGEVTFKIAFWSTLDRVQHVTGKFQYTLQSLDPGRFDWLYLESPSYA